MTTKNKDANFIQELINWRNDNSPSPRKITIFPTALCYTRCLFCPRPGNQHENYQAEVSYKKWKQIVQEGVKLNVREWEISGGGDPLYAKDRTITIVNTLKILDPSAYCQIITNGLNLTSTEIRNLVKKKVDKIYISIENPTEEINDYLLNFKGALKRQIISLHKFAEYKQKLKSKYPVLIFNTILTNNLYNELQDMINLASKYNIETIHVLPLEIFPNTQKKMQPFNIPIERIPKIIFELSKYKKMAFRKGVNLDYNSISNTGQNNIVINENRKVEKKVLKIKKRFMKKKEYICMLLDAICYEPFYGIVIDMYGGTSPCCVAGEGNRKININNMNLYQIWNSTYFQKLRENAIHQIPIYYCHRCSQSNRTENFKHILKKIVTEK